MLREAMGRRGLFKRLGVGALLAASGQENIAKAARLGTGLGIPPMSDGTQPQQIKAFRVFTQATEFSTWWKEFGKDEAYRSFFHVNSIDPDIAGFRLPLSTKVRMMRERRYARLKAEAHIGFLRRLFRDGKFQVFDNGPDYFSSCATAPGSSF